MNDLVQDGTTINMETYQELSISKSALLKETFPEEPFSDYDGSTAFYSESFGSISGFEQAGTSVLHFTNFGFSGIPYRRVNLKSPPVESPEQSHIEKVNNDRITLLARKYVSKEKFSDEESARLAIVTERLRKLMPAITSKEVEAVASALERVMQIAESDIALRNLIEQSK